MSTAPKPPDTNVCGFCKFDMPASERVCPACGHPPPFLNVRAVEKEREHVETHLARMLADYAVSPELLDRIRELVLQCHVVMCRNVGDVDFMTRTLHDMLPTHLQLQRAGLRPFRHNDAWEEYRHKAALDLFTGYGEDIHFAVLSPDDTGIPKYGEFTLVFRDDMIEHRTTFFEENTAKWWHNHCAIFPKDSPAGHRCLWEDRIKLAISKLASKLHSADAAVSLKTLLLNADDDDYIEANIYGPVSLRSFQLVKVKEAEITNKLRFVIEDDFPTVKLVVE